jgi:hypothetical protein
MASCTQPGSSRVCARPESVLGYCNCQVCQQRGEKEKYQIEEVNNNQIDMEYKDNLPINKNLPFKAKFSFDLHVIKETKRTQKA